MQEGYYYHKTAKAILDLYESLPASIRKEVLNLITLTEKQPARDQSPAGKEREKQFYTWIAENRAGLPEGYKFNREDANDR